MKILSFFGRRTQQISEAAIAARHEQESLAAEFAERRRMLEMCGGPASFLAQGTLEGDPVFEMRPNGREMATLTLRCRNTLLARSCLDGKRASDGTLLREPSSLNGPETITLRVMAEDDVQDIKYRRLVAGDFLLCEAFHYVPFDPEMPLRSDEYVSSLWRQWYLKSLIGVNKQRLRAA